MIIMCWCEGGTTPCMSRGLSVSSSWSQSNFIIKLHSVLALHVALTNYTIWQLSFCREEPSKVQRKPPLSYYRIFSWTKKNNIDINHSWLHNIGCLSEIAPVRPHQMIVICAKMFSIETTVRVVGGELGALGRCQIKLEIPICPNVILPQILVPRLKVSICPKVLIPLDLDFPYVESTGRPIISWMMINQFVEILDLGNFLSFFFTGSLLGCD